VEEVKASTQATNNHMNETIQQGKRCITHYSRDADDNILYTTHHFTVKELTELFQEGGFVDGREQEVQEKSSRRPEEVANFLYAMARKSYGAIVAKNNTSNKSRE